jgi:hypothetical protein
MSGHGRSEKNKWPLLTCHGMEDLRKINYLYWHVRAWKIWEKQNTFTDMSGHGRSEKNKLPLLTYQGMEDLRKINYLYWHVRAWKIWEKQITFTDMSGPWRGRAEETPLQVTCEWHYIILPSNENGACETMKVIMNCFACNKQSKVLIYMYLHSWESNSFICRTYRYTVYMSWILKYNKTALIQHDQFTDLSLTKRMWT